LSISFDILNLICIFYTLKQHLFEKTFNEKVNSLLLYIYIYIYAL